MMLRTLAMAAAVLSASLLLPAGQAVPLEEGCVRETASGCLLDPARPTDSARTAAGGAAGVVEWGQEGMESVRDGCVRFGGGSCLASNPGRAAGTGIAAGRSLADWGLFLADQLPLSPPPVARQAEQAAWSLAEWGVFLGRQGSGLAQAALAGSPEAADAVGAAAGSGLDGAAAALALGQQNTGDARARAEQAREAAGAAGRQALADGWDQAATGAAVAEEAYAAAERGPLGAATALALDAAGGALAEAAGALRQAGDAPEAAGSLQDDAGSGMDAPDGPRPTVRIEAGRVYEGTLSGALGDGGDWYAFEAGANDQVQLEVEAAGGELCWFGIFDAEGRRAPGAACQTTAGPLLRSATTVLLPWGGTWYIGSDEPGSSRAEPGRYRFAIGVGAPAPAASAADPGRLAVEAYGALTAALGSLAVPQDDAGSGTDAPDGPWPLVRVEPGTAYTGAVAGALGDGADWYAFEASAGDRLELQERSASGLSCRFEILDAAGRQVPGTQCGSTDLVQGTSTTEAVLPQSGTWYIAVRASGPGPDRQSFAFALNGPSPALPPL